MKRILFAVLVAAFLLTACGRPMQASAPAAPVYMEPAYGGGGDVYVPESAPREMAETEQAVRGNESTLGRERLVIRNADLSIVVSDPEASMDDIAQLANQMDGFVVSSNLYQAYTPSGHPVPEANMVVRVPAEKLDETLETIKADAVEVQSESQSGQDVTSEYVDLESRLRNLEAAEEQLTEIMRNATDTEDVLNVFNELTDIRSQIEVIKGQMKYYEESAALSAISIHLVAEETIQPLQVLGWQPKGTVNDAIQNLIYFFQDFVDFLIWLVLNILPKLLLIGIVFGLPIWLIVRAVRNARKRKAAQAPQEEK